MAITRDLISDIQENSREGDLEAAAMMRGGVPAVMKLGLDGSSEQDINNALQQNETGDADLLAANFAGKIAYDHAESAWYIYTRNYWQPDRKRQVFELLIRDIAPLYLHAAAIAQSNKETELVKELTARAKALNAYKRINNVLSLATANPRLALTGDEWDTKPWVLGVANGVIDLVTGVYRPGDPKDYIRAHAPVNWEGLETPAPKWEKFISEIFNGDVELIAFVQRLLGYAIAGQSTEHILPIFWGEGRNGKSTLLEVLGAVLGSSLAMSSQADALMDKSGGDAPQPFVYAMRGKRLVWASESNEGRRINAGLVKSLTGGDTVNVRTLHTKPVAFKPSWLLLLLTNHKPHMPADDQAIWDRVYLIPFNLRFVDDPKANNERKKDACIKDKLLTEAAGILAWLVRGCLEWQQSGLKPPASVQAATEEYRTEEDTLGLFIADECIESPDVKAKSATLYEQYKIWCGKCNIPAMSLTAFGKRLARKYERIESHGIYYLGIGLAQNDN